MRLQGFQRTVTLGWWSWFRAVCRGIPKIGWLRQPSYSAGRSGRSYDRLIYIHQIHIFYQLYYIIDAAFKWWTPSWMSSFRPSHTSVVRCGSCSRVLRSRDGLSCTWVHWWCATDHRWSTHPPLFHFSLLIFPQWVRRWWVHLPLVIFLPLQKVALLVLGVRWGSGRICTQLHFQWWFLRGRVLSPWYWAVSSW